MRSASQPATAPGTVTEWMPRLRHLGMSLRLQQRRRQAGRRPAAGVEAVERAGLRVVDDGEQIAADAVRLRLDQAHDGVGRDGGVDRVAASLEDLHAGLRRERLAGGDDAVFGRDPRSADDDAHGLHPTHFRRHAAILDVESDFVQFV